MDRLAHRNVKLRADVSFLNKCLEYQVTPKFLRFRTSNRTLDRSAAYSRSQLLLLKQELRNKQRELGRVSLQLSSLRQEVLGVLSALDCCCFRLWLSQSARKFASSVNNIHERKLSKLSPDFRVTSLKPDEVILNLSDHRLSVAEQNALVNGLCYTLSTGDFSDIDFDASLEIAARKLKRHVTESDSWEEVKQQIIAAKTKTKNAPRERSLRDKASAKILRELG